MKRNARTLIISTAVVIVAALGFHLFLSSRIRALQGYVAALRAQGEKVTFAELSATYTRFTNEAMTSLTNVVASLGPAPVDIASLRMQRFVARNRTRHEERLVELVTRPNATNTPALSWAEIDRRVAEAGHVLRQLQGIVASPVLNHGRRNLSFECPVFTREKKLARDWLASAALSHLRKGDHQSALANIDAVARLANFHSEEHALFEQMTRIEIADSGIELAWEALQRGGWKDHQLSALQQMWERFDFLTAIVKAIEGERAVPLEFLARLRETRWHLHCDPAESITTYCHRLSFPKGILENDTLAGLDYLQGTLKLARQLRDGQAFNEVMQSLKAREARTDERGRSTTRIFYPISLTIVPALSKAVERAGQTEVMRRLTVVALALHRYELKHGRFPSSLDLLTPEFLASIPRDCMDGRRLKYRLNTDGTFSLYSAGPDGQDDGGDLTPVQWGAGFGKGRDTVWPTALKATMAQR